MQKASDPYAGLPDLLFDYPVEGVLRMRLNGPKRNILSMEAHAALADVWPTMDADPQARVILVEGMGDSFCAGGTFEEIEEMIEFPEARLKSLREGWSLVNNMINCSKPIISAVRGPAVGTGCALAVLADISIVAESARLIDGHIRLGVAAGDHAAISWPLLCGMAKAKLFLLTGDEISGREAERIGLVSQCVPDEDLSQRALEIAERLANGPQTAIRWTKHAMNNWYRQAGPMFDASLALEIIGMGLPDVREGVASLRERRAPDFRKGAAGPGPSGTG
jgi:enoyl-CoA hydratase